MLRYQFLETVSRRTLLGIRFWDPALNSQIRLGLRAALYPIENPRKRIFAACTRSSVYAFNEIPGMIDLETRVTDSTETPASPASTRQFVLEVSDPRQRYGSVAASIELPLPYNGLFLTDDDAGSPGSPPPGFNLYSSINRQPASQFIFVRGQLINRNTGQSASNALVRIATEGEFNWYGVSDADGKFAVLMPYPFLNISYGSSPPSSDGVRMFQRTWPVSVGVFFEPMSQVPLPGTDLSDYSSVLNQEQAFIYTETPDTDSGEVVEMPAELVYGRDLTIKTAGFSELFISPTGSPA